MYLLNCTAKELFQMTSEICTVFNSIIDVDVRCTDDENRTEPGIWCIDYDDCCLKLFSQYIRLLRGQGIINKSIDERIFAVALRNKMIEVVDKMHETLEKGDNFNENHCIDIDCIPADICSFIVYHINDCKFMLDSNRYSNSYIARNRERVKSIRIIHNFAVALAALTAMTNALYNISTKLTIDGYTCKHIAMYILHAAKTIIREKLMIIEYENKSNSLGMPKDYMQFFQDAALCVIEDLDICIDDIMMQISEAIRIGGCRF